MRNISAKLAMIDLTNISFLDKTTNLEQKEIVPLTFTFQDEFPENPENFADERKTEISINEGNDRSNLLDIQEGFSNKKILSVQKEMNKLEKNEENVIYF